MATITLEVKLEDLRLDEKQIKQLESDIQAVVGRSLVSSAPREAALGSKLKIRPEWYGIWIKSFKNLEELKLNREFQQFQR